jgi:hypothetical protein
VCAQGDFTLAVEAQGAAGLSACREEEAALDGRERAKRQSQGATVRRAVIDMVYSATETCCKCGKEIFLKNVTSYKVLENFRLICADCAIADGLINPPETD